MLKRRPWWLDYLLDRFRWYRRLCGGHWEQWWVMPPVASETRVQKAHDADPPYGCVVRDWCEDWPERPAKAKGE